MSARLTARVAWSCAALAVLCAAAYLVLLRVDVTRQAHLTLQNYWLPGTFWTIAWPILGAIVLSKHPSNRLAWVFVFLGLGSGIGLFGGQYVIHGAVVDQHTLPAIPAVAWVARMISDASWGATILVPQLFPTGHVLSSRWRWLLRLTFALLGFGAFFDALRPGRLSDLPVDNPLGLAVLGSPAVQAALAAVFVPTVAVVVIGSLTSLVLRYRRSRGAERQQMKVFVAAMVFTVVGVLLVPSTIPYYFVTNAALSLVAPAALGIAILRYRLYDIDRVISRTFSYALLTGLLVAVYALLVTGVTRLLPVSSSLAVALATLVAAALFQPLRTRLQAAVDRRFNRARYNAERTIEAFSRRLRGEVDLQSVRDDLLVVVGTTVQPAHATVWLRSQHKH